MPKSQGQTKADRKHGVTVALITAGGLVFAAIIAGLFSLLNGAKNSRTAGPSQSFSSNKIAIGVQDSSGNTFYVNPTDPKAIVDAVVNEMDRDRARVEALSNEVRRLKQEIKTQDDQHKKLLAEKENEIAVNVENIFELKRKLDAFASIQQLSPIDQARVTNAVAVAQAQKVSSTFSGKLEIRGNVEIR